MEIQSATAASSALFSPLEWSCEQVASWADKQVARASYGKLFQENQIDGSMLPLLTCHDMEQMGIACLGHRKYLERAVRRLYARPCFLDPPTPSSSSTGLDNLSVRSLASGVLHSFYAMCTDYPWVYYSLKDTVVVQVVREAQELVTADAVVAPPFAADEDFLRWAEALLLISKLCLEGREHFQKSFVQLPHPQQSFNEYIPSFALSAPD